MTRNQPSRADISLDGEATRNRIGKVERVLNSIGIEYGLLYGGGLESNPEEIITIYLYNAPPSVVDLITWVLSESARA